MEKNIGTAEAAGALRHISRNESFKSYVLSTPGLHDLLLKAVSRFIGGESLTECLPKARALGSLGLSLAVDYMGESTRDRATAEHATDEFLRVIEALRESSKSIFLSPDLSHLGLLVDPELAYRNIARLAEAALDVKGEVIINMEGSDRTDAILEMHKRVCQRYENVGITLQAYLYRTPKDLAEALQRPGRIRLVKGAYEEPEALAARWGQPTDSAFCALMETLLASGHPCLIATHDEALLEHAQTHIRKHRIPATPIEFEMNFGICQDRLERLRDAGYRTRVYLPYGKEWFLYLCHRLAEFPPNVFRAIVDLSEGLGAEQAPPKATCSSS